MDVASDEELIRFMKTAFDGVCQGSLDLLVGRELARFAKNLRYGRPGGEDAGDTPANEEDGDEA